MYVFELDDRKMFAMTQVGTPYYIAPEVCQNRVYTNKIDMWSLGCSNEKDECEL